LGVTLCVYFHVLPDTEREAADKTDTALKVFRPNRPIERRSPIPPNQLNVYQWSIPVGLLIWGRLTEAHPVPDSTEIHAD
jgi:hypothetical protein